jgi:hypothetical protein
VKQLNQRERMLASATGVVILGGLVFTQLIEPTITEWGQLSDQVFVQEQAVERDQIQQRKLARLREALLELEESLMPPVGVGPIPWFLSHIEELGREASFVPSSLRYLRAEPLGNGPYAELRFELRAQATSSQLQAFLVQLASSPRHVRVVALGLTPQRGDGDLEVGLTLVALAPRDMLEESK